MKPWKTIQDGIDHATNDTIVAVATGVYNENVVITGKLVRLWGRCPSGQERVELVGQAGGDEAAVEVRGANASGSHVQGIGVSGDGVGIAIVDASDVMVHSVWVHDTSNRGIDVRNNLGSTPVTIERSLIESAFAFGLYVKDARTTIGETVIRGTVPMAGASEETFGRGVNILGSPHVILRGSLVEDNHDVGTFIADSTVDIDATVIRNTIPRSSGGGGRGIEAQSSPDVDQPSNITLKRSLLEGNRDFGVFVSRNSTATIESTVVRNTSPDDHGEFGVGIGIQKQSTLELRSSLVDHNHQAGVAVSNGSTATIERTIVRGTLPDNAGDYGKGIEVQEGSNLTLRGSLIDHNHQFGVGVIKESTAIIESTTVRDTFWDGHGSFGWGIAVIWQSELKLTGSLVDNNRGYGIFSDSSILIISSTIVRDTLPGAQIGGGIGIQAQAKFQTAEPSNLTLRESLIEDNYGGVAVISSSADINATVVRGGLMIDEAFSGDGVTVQSIPVPAYPPASATIQGSRIEHNERAGIASFDADVTLLSSIIYCNGINLNGLAAAGADPSLFDATDILCGGEPDKSVCSEEYMTLSEICGVKGYELTPPVEINPEPPSP